MVGLPGSSLAKPMGPARSVWAWWSNSSTSFRLAPEQKAFPPAPVTTRTRAESSAVKASIASARPTAMAAVMLLWASGRLSVTSVTGPRCSTSSSSIGKTSLAALSAGGYAETIRPVPPCVRLPAPPPVVVVVGDGGSGTVAVVTGSVRRGRLSWRGGLPGRAGRPPGPGAGGGGGGGGGGGSPPGGGAGRAAEAGGCVAPRPARGG